MKKIILLIILVLAAAVCWYNAFVKLQSSKKASMSPYQPELRPFALIVGDDWLDDEPFLIEYHKPVELDGLTREEVMALRKKSIDVNADLIKGEYVYSNAVFGKIKDKLSWWGLKGQLCYGPGDKSIEGPSEESRFILNPFLLLMVNNANAFINKDILCEPVLPGPPLFSKWFPKEKRLDIGYDMSRFLSQRLAQHGYEGSKPVDIMAMNARDFGYNYIYFDPEYTKGVSEVIEKSAFDDVHRLKDYIHKGGSCGYPGGCNNGSPSQPQIYFKVDYLPAMLHAKLWKEKPADKDVMSEVTVRLIFE